MAFTKRSRLQKPRLRTFTVLIRLLIMPFAGPLVARRMMALTMPTRATGTIQTAPRSCSDSFCGWRPLPCSSQARAVRPGARVEPRERQLLGVCLPAGFRQPLPLDAHQHPVALSSTAPGALPQPPHPNTPPASKFRRRSSLPVSGSNSALSTYHGCSSPTACSNSRMPFTATLPARSPWPPAPRNPGSRLRGSTRGPERSAPGGHHALQGGYRNRPSRRAIPPKDGSSLFRMGEG